MLQAGTSAVVVLGGLLEESDRMAGDLATALERSRIAGQACEAVMEGLKDVLKASESLQTKGSGGP